MPERNPKVSPIPPSEAPQSASVGDLLKDSIAEAASEIKEVSPDEVEELIQHGRIEREVMLLSTLKATFHTLTRLEKVKAASRLPRIRERFYSVLSTKSAESEEYVSQIPVLVEAITKLEFIRKDGSSKIRDFSTAESKNTLESLLCDPKTADFFVTLLYTAYLDLVVELAEVFDAGVKKN